MFPQRCWVYAWPGGRHRAAYAGGGQPRQLDSGAVGIFEGECASKALLRDSLASQAHGRQYLQGAVVDPFGPTTAIPYTPLGPNANRCHRCRFQVINITARQRLSTTPGPVTTERCWRSRHDRHCSLKGPFCRKQCMLQQTHTTKRTLFGVRFGTSNCSPGL